MIFQEFFGHVVDFVAGMNMTYMDLGEMSSSVQPAVEAAFFVTMGLAVLPPLLRPSAAWGIGDMSEQNCPFRICSVSANQAPAE
jgi:hypothetical protein